MIRPAAEAGAVAVGLDGAVDGWIIKGEGKANVVLGNVKSAHLRGKVYRVRKWRKTNRNDCQGPASRLQEELWTFATSDPTQREIAYAREVLGPILGLEHIKTGEPAPLPEGCVQALKRYNVRPDPQMQALLMPDHTLFPSSIAATPQGAMQLVGPCMSVEIKPKCGVLPKSEAIHPANAAKKRLPRFLLHQHLKQEEGRVSLRSEYNPLDLFSMDAERMFTAILALLQSPQNNLRLFRDGILVHGALHKSAQQQQPPSRGRNLFPQLEGLLTGMLPAASGADGTQHAGHNGCSLCGDRTEPPEQHAPSCSAGLEPRPQPPLQPAADDEWHGRPPPRAPAANGELAASQDSGLVPLPAALRSLEGRPAVAELVLLVQRVLEKEGILERVRRVQLLDSHDIEGVYPLYQHLLRQEGAEGLEADDGADVGQDAAGGGASEWERCAAQQQPCRCRPAADAGTPTSSDGSAAGGGARRAGCAAETHAAAAVRALQQQPREQALQILRDYLMAATAKDCAIMLTLQRCAPSAGYGAAGREGVRMGKLLPAQRSCGWYLYKLSLVDLDLKPLSKLDEHRQLDARIMQYFNRLHASPA